jgi:hypothetical protein
VTIGDLFEAVKIVTIKSATKANGNIDRAKADRMLDPHGYFSKNKRKIKRR